VVGFVIFLFLMAAVGAWLYYLKDKECTELKYGPSLWYMEKRQQLVDLVIANSGARRSVTEEQRKEVSRAVDVLLGDVCRASAERDADSLAKVLVKRQMDGQLASTYKPHLMQMTSDSWTWPSEEVTVSDICHSLEDARRQLSSIERLAVLDALRGIVKLVGGESGGGHSHAQSLGQETEKNMASERKVPRELEGIKPPSMRTPAVGGRPCRQPWELSLSELLAPLRRAKVDSLNALERRVSEPSCLNTSEDPNDAPPWFPNVDPSDRKPLSRQERNDLFKDVLIGNMGSSPLDPSGKPELSALLESMDETFRATRAWMVHDVDPGW
jgi:hypothetical protein